MKHFWKSQSLAFPRSLGFFRHHLLSLIHIYQASVSGDTATFYVPSSAHKGESGAYTTHIYLYDKAGKLAPLKGVNVTVPSAVVTPPTPSSSLSIGDVSIRCV